MAPANASWNVMPPSSCLRTQARIGQGQQEQPRRQAQPQYVAHSKTPLYHNGIFRHCAGTGTDRNKAAPHPSNAQPRLQQRNANAAHMSADAHAPRPTARWSQSPTPAETPSRTSPHRRKTASRAGHFRPAVSRHFVVRIRCAPTSAGRIHAPARAFPAGKIADGDVVESAVKLLPEMRIAA